MKKYIIIACLQIHLLSGASKEAYVQIYSTLTQKPQKIVGTLLIGENITDIKNFELSPNKDFLTCNVSGIYFVSASIQPAALTLGINGELYAWFEHNHKPISASSTIAYVTEKAPIAVITIPFLFELKAGDTIATRFASSGENIGVTYIAPTSNAEPSTPSYVLCIYKVDNS